MVALGNPFHKRGPLGRVQGNLRLVKQSVQFRVLEPHVILASVAVKHGAGVPVWSLQPSASACCDGGDLESIELAPVHQALEHGLVPLLYGDVALDQSQGGTIISTEQIFAHLAHHLHPARLILVGTVDGVYDADPVRDPAAQLISSISTANWASIRAHLGGSHGTDVTGGMLSKVEEMIRLARQMPGLEVQLISGEPVDALKTALLRSARVPVGTTIRR